MADVVIKGVNVVNLFSWTVEKTNVAIQSGYVVGVGTSYTEGRTTYEFPGMYLVPGFVDGHIHLESSFLVPQNFAKAVIAHGTTACVLDPHEIANVAGVRGVLWLVEQCRHLPVDFFFMAPSCVPASDLETSGAEITPKDVERMLALDKCLGLGEIMDFPGVISANDELLDKIGRALRSGKRVDGHAPGISGMDLNAYLSAQVETDHECTTRDEALEKLKRGMKVMIREGSHAKNLASLHSLVGSENYRRFMLVSDDVSPQFLVKEGHIDRILKKAAKLGMNPFMTVSLVTLNPCEHFRLNRCGGVAPGFVADLVVVRDLKSFRVEAVFKNGEPVWREGELCMELKAHGLDELRGTVKVRLPVDLTLKAEGEQAKVIGLVAEQLVTRRLIRKVRREDGRVLADPDSFTAADWPL